MQKVMNNKSNIFDEEFSLYNSPYFSKNRVFYVCSYGGCGSRMLCRYLGFFGIVRHIHSRIPPLYNLTRPYNIDGMHEFFNLDDVVDVNVNKEQQEIKYVVIYLYRNPIKAIESRFILNDYPNIPFTRHLRNIQCPQITTTLLDVIKFQTDLYGIEEFFNNYVYPKNKRNYNVVCVKYESLWDNIKEFNRTVGIPNCPKCYQPRYESKHNVILSPENNCVLNIVYQSLIKKMQLMSPIEIR